METPDIQFGEFQIKVIVSDGLIESFDSEVTAPGVGPDLHYHTRMDEIFFIQSGTVLITVDREQIVATPGMIVRVPKMTPHAWKSQDGPARLLITFIPGAQQTMYYKELGELVRSGDSWREGNGILQKKYDNIPLP